MPASSKDYQSSGAKVVIATCAALAIAALGCLVFAPNPATGAPPTASAFVLLSDKDGHGSGVHIGNGYVITAAHVVGASKTLTLKASDGKSQAATVLWSSKEYDVALMRAAKPDYLETADLDCAPNFDGQAVVAHGNPMDLEFVSSAGRVVGAAQAKGPWSSVVPVDMTIVPGQSGGAVVNDGGDVVGIAVGVMSYNMGVTGFGMVVPADVICMLLAR